MFITKRLMKQRKNRLLLKRDKNITPFFDGQARLMLQNPVNL